MNFNAPIPGQSLTIEPGNAPWEQPPKTEDMDEAVRLHLKRLNSPKVIESVSFLLEIGMPVRAITESIMTSAVMAGIHSIDMSLLVAPVVHEQVKTIGDEAGIEYDEGFEEPDRVKQERERSMLTAKIKAKLKTMGKTSTDARSVVEQGVEALATPEEDYVDAAPQEADMQPTDAMAPTAAKRGIMARSV